MQRVHRLLAAAAPKLFRDLVVLTGGQVVSKLIGLLVFAFLARTLDPEGYGAVEYVLGLTAFFAVAVDCGLGTVGVKRVARAPRELPLLATQIPVARLGLALLAMIAMIIVMRLLGSPTIPSALVWLYAASLLFSAFNQDWLLQSAELMTHIAVAQTIRALTFATVVVLLVHAPPDVAAVGWAEIAATALVSVYYVSVQHFRIAPIRLLPTALRLIELVREGASIGLSRFAWAAAQYMPLFLTGSIVGGADVGWFAAAQRVVTSISTFSFVYHFNLYPALAKASAASSADLAGLLRSSFRVTAWASIGGALALTLTAAPVLTLIYGGRYAAAATPLVILVWTIPVTVLSGHARWALIVADCQRYALYGQIVGLLVVTVVGVPLVLLRGSIGAAAAAVVGAVAGWLVSHAYARRLKAAPPGASVAAKPLLLALTLLALAHLTGLGLLMQLISGLAIYVVAAPLLDRSLIPDLMQLAHARSRPAR